MARGVLLGGLLIARFGWHALFLIFGGLSLLWLVPWLAIARPDPIASAPAVAKRAAPGFAEMLSKREMWGAMLGHFCSNYPYFMVLAWLPLYLVKQEGYSITAMAWLGGTVYLLSALVGLAGGRIADRWIARGGGVNRVRKTMMLVSIVTGLACMLACASGDPRFAVAGLLTYSLANGLGAFSVFSIGQTLAGPQLRGQMGRHAEWFCRAVRRGRPAGDRRADRRDRGLSRRLSARGGCGGNRHHMLGRRYPPGRARCLVRTLGSVKPVFSRRATDILS